MSAAPDYASMSRAQLQAEATRTVAVFEFTKQRLEAQAARLNRLLAEALTPPDDREVLPDGLVLHPALLQGTMAALAEVYDRMRRNESTRDEENEIAQEKKSDRAREADRRVATMAVALAENGGEGMISRHAGYVAFLEGVDLARIEGNRRRKVEALKSQQEAARTTGLNIIDRAQSKKRSNFIGFLGDAAGTLADDRRQRKQIEDEKQRGTTTLP